MQGEGNKRGNEGTPGQLPKAYAYPTGMFGYNNGKELYNIDEDPGPKHDIARTYPDQVAALRAFHDAGPTFAPTTEIYLGHPDHPVVNMTSHDWIQEAIQKKWSAEAWVWHPFFNR